MGERNLDQYRFQNLRRTAPDGGRPAPRRGAVQRCSGARRCLGRDTYCPAGRAVRAAMPVRVDGAQLYSTNLPNLDGLNEVNNEYNLDIPLNLPSGKHLIQI